MSKLSFIKTPQGISFKIPGKQSVLFSEKHPEYQNIVKYLKAQDFEAIEKILTPPAKKIELISNGVFKVYDEENGFRLIDDENTIVPEIIGKRIQEFYQEGYPFEPLINFWNKLKLNPSENSKKQVYKFLEFHHLPITEEGNFIVFKGVHADEEDENIFWSEHLDKNNKRVKNVLGEPVSMDRKDISDNPKSACSEGLHVGAYSYASKFISTSTGRTLEVLVDPKDVVSVPHDCSSAKIRVCKYIPLGLVDIIEKDKKVYNKEKFDTKYEDLLEDETTDEYYDDGESYDEFGEPDDELEDDDNDPDISYSESHGVDIDSLTFNPLEFNEQYNVLQIIDILEELNDDGVLEIKQKDLDYFNVLKTDLNKRKNKKSIIIKITKIFVENGFEIE